MLTATYPQTAGLVCGLHFVVTGVVLVLPRVTMGTTTMGIPANIPKFSIKKGLALRRHYCRS